MRSYTDGRGNAWAVEVTALTRDKIWAVCGVDVYDAVDEGKAAKLWGHLQWQPNLLRALWVIVEAEARARNVDEDGFRDGHSGDVFDAAAEAIEGAIFDFFPRSLRRMMEAAATARKQAEAEAIEAYERMIQSPELKQKLRDELVAVEGGIRARLKLPPPTSNGLCTNSPESSASIPDNGRFAGCSSPPGNEGWKNGTAAPASRGPC